MGSEDTRFWSKVDKTDDCWLWVGGTGWHGYGLFNAGQRGSYKTVLAHRWAYEHGIGPTPPGWVLHHACLTRSCVRPAHLVSMTRQENSSQPRHRKTHCKRGHPLVGDNLYVYGTQRHCRTCMIQYSRRRRLNGND